MEPILDTRGQEPAEPLPASSEVVVIGGGVVGCATAYQLARRGVDVALVEAGAISGGASGRNGGFVAYGMVNPGVPGMHAWTALNRRILRELDAAWDGCFDYRENGSLRLAVGGEEMAALHQRAEELRAEGVEVEVIDAEAAHRLCPLLSDRLTGALHNPRTAQITPYKLVFAYRDHAVEHGARVYEATPAGGFAIRDGAIQAVETTRGTIRCRWAVLATNAWAAQLGARAGVWLPIRPTRGQIMVTQPLDAEVGVNLTSEFEYWRQTPTGEIVGGGGRRPDRDSFTYSTETTRSAVRSFRGGMASYMPAVGRLRVRQVWAGTMGYTLDRAPLIGEVSSPRGLIVAAGFSGNGNPFASAVGHSLAEYITAGATEIDMRGVRPERFATPWHRL